MNHQVKLTGNLKTYLRWPMTLSLLWAVATIQIYMVNHKAGYCVAGYTLAYFVFAMMLRMTGRKKLQQDLIQCVRVADGFVSCDIDLVLLFIRDQALVDLRVLVGRDDRVVRRLLLTGRQEKQKNTQHRYHS